MFATFLTHSVPNVCISMTVPVKVGYYNMHLLLTWGWC